MKKCVCLSSMESMSQSCYSCRHRRRWRVCFCHANEKLAAAEEIVSVSSILCIYFLNIFGNTFPLYNLCIRRWIAHNHTRASPRLVQVFEFCVLSHAFWSWPICWAFSLLSSFFDVKFAHFVAFFWLDNFRPVLCVAMQVVEIIKWNSYQHEFFSGFVRMKCDRKNHQKNKTSFNDRTESESFCCCCCCVDANGSGESVAEGEPKNVFIHFECDLGSWL